MKKYLVAGLTAGALVYAGLVRVFPGLAVLGWLVVAGWHIMAILGTHSPLSAKALAEMTAMDQVSTSRAL